jgi:hypothetical protein
MDESIRQLCDAVHMCELVLTRTTDMLSRITRALDALHTHQVMAAAAQQDSFKLDKEVEERCAVTKVFSDR